MFKFSKRSLEYLEGCENDLIRLAKYAIKISPFDFGITCGLRTVEEQQELYFNNLSQIKKSKHLPNDRGLSEALDFAVWVSGKLTWDHEYYRPVVQAFFTGAIELGIQIESGALWKYFIDSPHIQLKTD